MRALTILFLALITISASARTRLPNVARSGHFYGDEAGRMVGLEGKRFPTRQELKLEAIRTSYGVECPPEKRERFVNGFITGFISGWAKGIVKASAERRARLEWDAVAPKETVVVSETVSKPED